VAAFRPNGAFGPDGPLLLGIGMIAALISAGAWLHVATHLGLPVSTTHSIVGAIVGVGVAAFGLSGVDWAMLLQIVLSWVVSPVLGGVLAYLSFIAVRRLILDNEDPIAATRRIGPYLVGFVVTIIVLSVIYKALANVLDDPPFALALGASLAVGALFAALTALFMRSFQPDGSNPYVFVERNFAILQIATACFVAFAHGANDVANAIGPLAAVVDLYRTGFAAVPTEVPVPIWVLVLGGTGIVIGLATYGYKVIGTIGSQITEITPTRGFAAEFGAASTVLVASRIGLPVSTTHTLVGAVIGVGFARGLAALNMRVIRNIANSWLATVPAAAIVAAVLFLIARLIVL
ncbi:MAG: inorganic phosphate transporter, partial [Longimicrobiales bacterium]